MTEIEEVVSLAAVPQARPNTPEIVERVVREKLNIAFVQGENEPRAHSMQAKFSLDDNDTALFDECARHFHSVIQGFYEENNDLDSLPQLITSRFPTMVYFFGHGDYGVARMNKFKEHVARFQNQPAASEETE